MGESQNTDLVESLEDRSRGVVVRPYKPDNDPFIFRLGISTLSAVTIVGLGLVGYLSVKGIEVPQTLTAIASASLGALVGLFSKR